MMNNKFLLGYSVALTIAIGVLFYKLYSLTPTDRTESQKSTEQTHKSPTTETAIAYINTDTLSEKYKFFKDYKKQMEAEGRALEASYEGKVTNWQNKTMEFQKGAPSMTEEQIAQKRYDLELERETILKNHDQKTKELMDKTDLQNKKLLDNINEYINEYNKDGKYKYIFSYVKNGPLLYADKATDITEDIVKGLNEKYDKSKAK